jgi:ATP-dependent RNA helicase RhlE
LKAFLVDGIDAGKEGQRMSFDRFDLDPRCLALLQEQGIVTPTPVQEQAIPVVGAGRDLIATAQTGTGKTLGFALPCLTRLAREKVEANQMLVLVPTRELAYPVGRRLWRRQFRPTAGSLP